MGDQHLSALVRWNRSEVCGETGPKLLHRDAASLRDLGKTHAAKLSIKATVRLIVQGEENDRVLSVLSNNPVVQWDQNKLS